MIDLIKMASLLKVNIENQTLTAFNESEVLLKEYSIATAKNGIGQEFGSECTPLGKHIVRAKIGDNEPLNTVFVGRRPTGEIHSAELNDKYPNRDWILTRILWLSGCEVGLNRLGNVDTMRRYIYIHGAPDSHSMGTPSSHGCIKMTNSDMMDLFAIVNVGTEVSIEA